MEPLVGKQTNEDTDRNREESKNERNSPLGTVQTCNDKGVAAEEDDDDLSSCHDGHHEHEQMVAVETLEDVELVIDASTVDELEDLHKDKDVEDEGADFAFVIAEDCIATEPEDETDDELVDRLPNDHLPHGDCDERCSSSFGFAVKETSGGGIGGESESGEGIHDEVDPEELNSVENGFLLVV